MPSRMNMPGAGYLSGDGAALNLPGAGYFTGLAVDVSSCAQLSNVSSWFASTIGGKAVNPLRRFTIGSSDYATRVNRWPTFKRDADKIRPVSLSIPLVNDDKALNYLINADTLLNTDVALGYGLTHPTSGDEYLDLFQGTIESVRMVGGTLTLGLMDRFKGFSETILGDTTSDGALSFADSDYFPGDLVWSLVTSHGGLSAIESSSNPDIDYDSWAAWKTAFEEDQIRINARFTGQKMIDAVSKMAKLTDSTFIFENNRLRFFRQDTTAPCDYMYLGDTVIKKVSVALNDKDIVNKQRVAGGYSVESSYFTVNVVEVDSASQSTFGVRDKSYGDSSIWFVNSLSARNLAERQIFKLANPVRKYDIATTMKPVPLVTGDGLRFSDDQLDVSSATGFLMSGIVIDMDTGAVTVKTKTQKILQPFILDVATWSVLDQSYNYLL